MAGKKRTSVDLSPEEIIFEHEGETFRLLRLNTKSMNVDALLMQNGESTPVVIPFAHLPKKIKQRIRPLQ